MCMCRSTSEADSEFIIKQIFEQIPTPSFVLFYFCFFSFFLRIKLLLLQFAHRKDIVDCRIDKNIIDCNFINS